MPTPKIKKRRTIDGIPIPDGLYAPNEDVRVYRPNRNLPVVTVRPSLETMASVSDATAYRNPVVLTQPMSENEYQIRQSQQRGTGNVSSRRETLSSRFYDAMPTSVQNNLDRLRTYRENFESSAPGEVAMYSPYGLVSAGLDLANARNPKDAALAGIILVGGRPMRTIGARRNALSKIVGADAPIIRRPGTYKKVENMLYEEAYDADRLINTKRYNRPLRKAGKARLEAKIKKANEFADAQNAVSQNNMERINKIAERRANRQDYGLFSTNRSRAFDDKLGIVKDHSKTVQQERNKILERHSLEREPYGYYNTTATRRTPTSTTSTTETPKPKSRTRRTLSNAKKYWWIPAGLGLTGLGLEAFGQ